MGKDINYLVYEIIKYDFFIIKYKKNYTGLDYEINLFRFM